MTMTISGSAATATGTTTSHDDESDDDVDVDVDRRRLQRRQWWRRPRCHDDDYDGAVGDDEDGDDDPYFPSWPELRSMVSMY